MAYPDEMDQTGKRRSRSLSAGVMAAIGAMLFLGMVLWGLTDKSGPTAGPVLNSTGSATTGSTVLPSSPGK